MTYAPTKLDTSLASYATFVAARLSKGLRRKASAQWAGYAAAAGASLSAAHVAEAAIIHVTPPSPIRVEIGDGVLPPGSSFSSSTEILDLNGDGVNDIEIGVGRGEFETTSLGIPRFDTFRGGGVSGYDGGQVLVSSTSSSARNLASGSTISGGQSFGDYGGIRGSFRSAVGDPVTSQTTSTYGNWGANSTGLVGVKFSVGGQTHFGWIRVATESDNDGRFRALEVRDWAYEDVPDMAIGAGQVPEPSTLGLATLALGAAGVATLRRRRKKVMTRRMH